MERFQEILDSDLDPTDRRVYEVDNQVIVYPTVEGASNPIVKAHEALLTLLMDKAFVVDGSMMV